MESLAPDDRSIAAARKLARPGPWSDTGSTDTLLWGKCQGSGSTPYQVTVDLTAPAVKCTCPSRKLPCKHGLALLLLWVGADGSVAETVAPADFASDWKEDRQRRAASTAAKRTDPVDPESRARRMSQRLDLMTSGMQELETWLADLIRQGLATARQRPYGWWDETAARLVDAQLPGLADRIRAMAGSVHARPDWADHLLGEAGRWFLATQAWARRDELSTTDMADLRAFIGWPLSSEEIRAGERVTDRWQIVGVHRTEDGRLQSQRTWLLGLETGRTVVALDFAAVGGALRVAHVVGTIVAATVSVYPGSAPQRVLLPEQLDPADRLHTFAGLLEPSTGRASVAAGLEQVAGYLGLNPWSDRLPLCLANVRIVDRGGTWLVDEADDALEVHGDADRWELLARTGGHPVDIFAELEDGALRPLTLAVDGELVPV